MKQKKKRSGRKTLKMKAMAKARAKA